MNLVKYYMEYSVVKCSYFDRFNLPQIMLSSEKIVGKFPEISVLTTFRIADPKQSLLISKKNYIFVFLVCQIIQNIDKICFKLGLRGWVISFIKILENGLIDDAKYLSRDLYSKAHQSMVKIRFIFYETKF